MRARPSGPSGSTRPSAMPASQTLGADERYEIHFATPKRPPFFQPKEKSKIEQGHRILEPLEGLRSPNSTSSIRKINLFHSPRAKAIGSSRNERVNSVHPGAVLEDPFESKAFSSHLKSLKYSINSTAAAESGSGAPLSSESNHLEFESSRPRKFPPSFSDENFLFPHDDLKSTLLLRPFEMYPNERNFIGKTDNFSIKIASSEQIERVGTREKVETREGRPVRVRYGEVENSETVSYKDFKHPHPGGLYCSRTFGPVKNWVCTNPGCSDTKKGVLPVSRKGNDEFLGSPDGRGKYRELKCSICGNALYPSTLRRYRMGYIHLYQPLVHVSYIHSRQNLFAHLLRWKAKEIHALIYNNLNLINFGHTELFSACFAPLFGFCEDSLGEALEWLRGDYFSLSDQATVVLRLLQPNETKTANRLSQLQRQSISGPNTTEGPTFGAARRAGPDGPTFSATSGPTYGASEGPSSMRIAHEELEWGVEFKRATGAVQPGSAIPWMKKWPLQPEPGILRTAWENSQNFPKKIESLRAPEFATVDTLLLEDQNFLINLVMNWKKIFNVPKERDLSLLEKFQVEIFEHDYHSLPGLHYFSSRYSPSEEGRTIIQKSNPPQNSIFQAFSQNDGGPNLSEGLDFPQLELFYEHTFGTLESFLKNTEGMYSENFTKNSFFLVQDFFTKFQSKFLQEKPLPRPKQAAAAILKWNAVKFSFSARRLDFACFRKNSEEKDFLEASEFGISPLQASSPASSVHQHLQTQKEPGDCTRSKMERTHKMLQTLLSMAVKRTVGKKEALHSGSCNSSEPNTTEGPTFGRVGFMRTVQNLRFPDLFSTDSTTVSAALNPKRIAMRKARWYGRGWGEPVARAIGAYFVEKLDENFSRRNLFGIRGWKDYHGKTFVPNFESKYRYTFGYQWGRETLILPPSPLKKAKENPLVSSFEYLASEWDSYNDFERFQVSPYLNYEQYKVFQALSEFKKDSDEVFANPLYRVKTPEYTAFANKHPHKATVLSGATEPNLPSFWLQQNQKSFLTSRVFIEFPPRYTFGGARHYSFNQDISSKLQPLKVAPLLNENFVSSLSEAGFVQKDIYQIGLPSIFPSFAWRSKAFTAADEIGSLQSKMPPPQQQALKAAPDSRDSFWSRKLGKRKWISFIGGKPKRHAETTPPSDQTKVRLLMKKGKGIDPTRPKVQPSVVLGSDPELTKVTHSTSAVLDQNGYPWRVEKILSSLRIYNLFGWEFQNWLPLYPLRRKGRLEINTYVFLRQNLVEHKTNEKAHLRNDGHAGQLNFLGQKPPFEALCEMFTRSSLPVPESSSPIRLGQATSLAASNRRSLFDLGEKSAKPTISSFMAPQVKLASRVSLAVDLEIQKKKTKFHVLGLENFERQKENLRSHLQSVLESLSATALDDFEKKNTPGEASRSFPPPASSDSFSGQHDSRLDIRSRWLPVQHFKCTPFQEIAKLSESQYALAKPYLLLSGIAQKLTRPKNQALKSWNFFDSLGVSLPPAHPGFAQNLVTSLDLSTPAKVKSLLETEIKKPYKIGRPSNDFLPPGNPFNSLKRFERSRIFDRNEILQEFEHLLGPENWFVEKSLPMQFLSQENEFHNFIGFLEYSPFGLKVQNRFLNRFDSLFFNPFFRFFISRLGNRNGGAFEGVENVIPQAQHDQRSNLRCYPQSGSGCLTLSEQSFYTQKSWNFSPRGIIRENDPLYRWLPSEQMMQRLIKLLGNASLGPNGPEMLLSQQPLEILRLKKGKTQVYTGTFKKLLEGKELSSLDKKGKPNNRKPAQGEKEGTRFALSSFHRQLQNLLFQKQSHNGFTQYHCEEGATILTQPLASENRRKTSSVQRLSATDPEVTLAPLKLSQAQPTGLAEFSLQSSFVHEPEYDLNHLFDLKSPDDFGPWKRWPEFAKFFLYNGGPTLKKYFRSENWPKTALLLRKRIRRSDPSVVFTKKLAKLFETPKYMGISQEKWKTFLFVKPNRTKPGLVKDKLNGYFREQRALLLAEEKRLAKEIRSLERERQNQHYDWSLFDLKEPERFREYEKQRDKAFKEFKNTYRKRQKSIEKKQPMKKAVAEKRKGLDQQTSPSVGPAGPALGAPPPVISATESGDERMNPQKQTEKEREEKAFDGGQPFSRGENVTNRVVSPNELVPPAEKFLTDDELFEEFIKFHYQPYIKMLKSNSISDEDYDNLLQQKDLEIENAKKIEASKAKRRTMRANLVYIDSVNIEKVFEQFPFSPDDVGWSTDESKKFSNTLSNPLWRNFLMHEMFRRNSMRDQHTLLKKDLVWEDFVSYHSSPLDVSSLRQNPITSPTPRGCLCRMNALVDFDHAVKRYDLTTRKADKKKADQYYQRFDEYLKAFQLPTAFGRENVEKNPNFPVKKRTRKIAEKKRLVKQYRAVLTLLKNPSCIERGVFDKFPILPPDLRPILQLGDVKAVSDMTALYILLIQRNLRHGKILFESYGESNEFLIDSKTMVQVAADNALDKCREKNVNNLIVGRMWDYKDSQNQMEQWASAKPKTKGPGALAGTNAPRTLYDRLSGKEGRFRMNLLGKRVDYSGRSVIIVGPSLKVDQCGLPYEMAFELFQPFLLRYMLEDPEKKVQKYLQYDPWIPDDTILDHLKWDDATKKISGTEPISAAAGNGTSTNIPGAGGLNPRRQDSIAGIQESSQQGGLPSTPETWSSKGSEGWTAGSTGEQPLKAADVGSSISVAVTALEESKPALDPSIFGSGSIKSLSQAKLILRKKKALGRMILRQIVPRFPVLLNRAPTLHRLGIQGFHPVLVYGRALHLHPLVCGSFNADFDGDQMAVHIPLSLKARFDIRMLMFAPVNWLSPATGQPTVVPSQDMVLGLFYMTLEKIALQKGRGAVFQTLSDAVQAYQTGMLEIQSQIWVKWNGPFANNQMNDESAQEIYDEPKKPECQFRRKPFFPENQNRFWKVEPVFQKPKNVSPDDQQSGYNRADMSFGGLKGLKGSGSSSVSSPPTRILSKTDLALLRQKFHSATFGTAGEMTVLARWWHDLNDSRVFSSALNRANLTAAPTRETNFLKQSSKFVPYRSVKESWFETVRRQKRRRHSSPVKYARKEGFFYHSFGRFANDEDEPLEIRVHQTGNSRKIYSDFQWSEDSKEENRVCYIRTTPGRALMNQLIYPAYEEHDDQSFRKIQK